MDRSTLSSSSTCRKRRWHRGEGRTLDRRLLLHPMGAERVEGSPGHRADRRIAALAEAQYGVVSRPQLAAAGLDRGAIAHRVKVGRLHRVHRTLLDLSTSVPRRALERAIEEAERLGVFDLKDVDALLVVTSGRAGSAVLAGVLRDHSFGTTITRS
ncbi:MAG TPA: type IV toxin-antitoxin system AbiEi family antitoxin domain-containing protein [Thermoleophilaceae bacterium]|nr:type IV toxin-antitoxin system AbiEi family antitoxin domain-containing protein [Thermoleophilaceae bacterium]